MKFLLHAPLLICFFTTLLPYAVAQIPTFPGAEGFGSTTPGGRGGTVIEVKNLNSGGPGSFREACEALTPRIVVFRTGGTIRIYKNIKIRNPYITIAGQTAPGDGICIRGAGLLISTHDVVIRGLRIRVGDDPYGPKPRNRDGITISNRYDPPNNIIIDHCSISWAVDENISTFQDCHNITLQWCIFSEGLRNSIHPEGQHSCGMKVGPNAKNISIHHNLFAHNYRRNPKLSRDQNSNCEVINNLIYNWRSRGTDILANVNTIGNVYKVGPDWRGNNKGVTVKAIYEIMAYVSENIGPGRPKNIGDDWLAVDGLEMHRSNKPVFPLSNVRIDTVTEVYELVLKNAGAVWPYQDPVDIRVIQSVRESTEGLIDSQADVGGWPVLNPGTPPKDSDQDGMPDYWEIAHGLNPYHSADGNEDQDGDGYTNVEEYLNSLIVLEE